MTSARMTFLRAVPEEAPGLPRSRPPVMTLRFSNFSLERIWLPGTSQSQHRFREDRTRTEGGLPWPNSGAKTNRRKASTAATTVATTTRTINPRAHAAAAAAKLRVRTPTGEIMGVTAEASSVRNLGGKALVERVVRNQPPCALRLLKSQRPGLKTCDDRQGWGQQDGGRALQPDRDRRGSVGPAPLR